MTSLEPPETSELPIHLGLSSNLDVRARSFGMIATDELLDYEGERFHPQGLFSQRIFGCVKSWHCECGKYSPDAAPPGIEREQFGLPYRTVCETCHVLLARNSIRRKRCGHIDFAAPILHPWLWGNANRPVELLLGLSTRELREIMRGTRYVLFSPNPWFQELMLAVVIGSRSQPTSTGMQDWESGFPALVHLLKTIDLPALADRLQRELAEISLEDVSTVRWKKHTRRLALVHDLISQNINPIDFVLEVLPVIPAGFRKIRCNSQQVIRVDKLTRRYQDILRHNNSIEKYIDDEEVLVPFRRRLTRLVSRLFEMLPGKFPYRLDKRLELPPRSALNPSPFRLYRRMPSRHVNATAEAAYRHSGDNKTRPSTKVVTHWKGKRVDFSAVSYVVPDASLQPHECGLPLDPIAWELYGTLVTGRIMWHNEFVHTISKAFVECRGTLALEHLIEIMRQWPVVLSIPTAHPGSRVRAFFARPVEDKAIHLHPAVMQQLGLQATGETAKVFLPLSGAAKNEAIEMVSASVDGKPLAHQPIHFWPAHEALLGCYLATRMEKGLLDTASLPVNLGHWRVFRSTEEIELAVDLGKLNWTTPIVYEIPPWRDVTSEVDERQPGGPKPQRILTSPGRVLLDMHVRAEIPTLDNISFYNRAMDRSLYRNIHDAFVAAGMQSELKQLAAILNTWGASRLTKLGLSLSTDDLNVAENKAKIVNEALTQVAKKQKLYDRGIICPTELQNQVLDVWVNAREQTTREIIDKLTSQATQSALSATLAARVDPNTSYMPMLRHLIGVSGSVARANGRLFQTPITSGLREGLTTSEYYLSAYAQRREAMLQKDRKTTARSLVRQLAPVLRDLRVKSDDCQTTQGLDKRALLNLHDGYRLRDLSESLAGRTSAETVLDPMTEDTLVDANQTLTRNHGIRLEENGCTSLRVRSPLTCNEVQGVCAACLGTHAGDRSRSSVGQAIGSQALLALADQLLRVTPTYHYFISRPWSGNAGELRAKHQGTTSFANLKVAADSQGTLRVVSRKGTIKIFDWKVRLVMEEEIPHGAQLHVRDVQPISPGTLLASWNPQAPQIYAQAHATVQLVDLLPGKNVEMANHPQGQSLWKVVYDLGPQRPMLILIDPVGLKLDYFYLPENTWVHVRDGQSVTPGTLLAETIIEPGRNSSNAIPGLAGIETPLRVAIPRERAILAQCHGKVEVSTLNAERRCNILIHELTSRGKPTKDIYTHPVSPYQRILVSTGEVVDVGQRLTAGPIALQDVLRLCGPVQASSQLLAQLMHPLAMQRPTMECHERLWELVLARMFSKVEMISCGILPGLPGKLVEGSWLRKENERLRQSVLVTDAGDSHLSPGCITSQADFQAVCEQIRQRTGKLPVGVRPRLAGFQPRLAGLTSTALRDAHPLLLQQSAFSISKLIQAAISGYYDEGNSIQSAMQTGRLIPAGTGWSSEES